MGSFRDYDRGAQMFEPVDRAYLEGEIDARQWHARVAAIVVPAYMSEVEPWAQSGHRGPLERWQKARRPILDAIDGPGLILDVGSANGFLLESLVSWAADEGVALDPYGIDISPDLVALAQRRIPNWTDRFEVGSIMDWRPSRQFDYVRTGLEYVPPGTEHRLVEHLLANVVSTSGRLIIGVFNERRDAAPSVADSIKEWSIPLAGSTASPHPDPDLEYRVVWIDASNRGG